MLYICSLKENLERKKIESINLIDSLNVKINELLEKVNSLEEQKLAYIETIENSEIENVNYIFILISFFLNSF